MYAILIFVHMKQVMQDIFDSEFASEIQEVIEKTVWSGLEQDLVSKMVTFANQYLAVNEKDVPATSLIRRRLKDFYNNRRALLLAKKDPVK